MFFIVIYFLNDMSSCSWTIWRASSWGSGLWSRFFFSLIRVPFGSQWVCIKLNYSPWTIQSIEFSRQNTGVGSRSLLQGIFPTKVSNPGLPTLQVDSLPTEPSRKPIKLNSVSLLVGFSYKVKPPECFSIQPYLSSFSLSPTSSRNVSTASSWATIPLFQVIGC